MREWALSGIWGREVHLLWEDKKYARAPEATNFPLSHVVEPLDDDARVAVPRPSASGAR